MPKNSFRADERTISPQLQVGEGHSDYAMRPKNFTEYCGQHEIKEQLSVFIAAARHRSDALDHVLLVGPPGLGKTSLAYVIAKELGVGFRCVGAPSISKLGELAAILTNLMPGDLLFIDEIHRLSPAIEEMLYPAMEDQQIDIMVGEGPGARAIKLDLCAFTLVGATTRAGLLTAPLRERFGIVQRLQLYSAEELKILLKMNASKLGIPIEEEAAELLAARARGVPRIVNRFLRRTRDMAQVLGKTVIDTESVQKTLKILQVDSQGLDAQDIQLLSILSKKFQGRPVGLETLAAALGEEAQTLEEVIEPYLIQQGFLQRTPRGRQPTIKAKRHLKKHIFDSARIEES